MIAENDDEEWKSNPVLQLVALKPIWLNHLYVHTMQSAVWEGIKTFQFAEFVHTYREESTMGYFQKILFQALTQLEAINSKHFRYMLWRIKY